MAAISTAPQLDNLGYLAEQIRQCQDKKELQAVVTSINRIIPKNHNELPQLRKAYQLRQEEIRQAQEQAKREAELKAITQEQEQAIDNYDKSGHL